MLELFVEFIPSLDCWNNWLSNHGFELAFTLILFAWGCEMYCSYRSVNEILSKHHLRKCTHNSDSLRKRSLRYFNKMSTEYLFIECTKTSLYGIWVEMPFLCSKINCDQIHQDIWCLTDGLVSLQLLQLARVTVWSVTLVLVGVVICSKECVTHNYEYILKRLKR